MNDTFYFKPFTYEELKKLTFTRPGETRIGQTLCMDKDDSAIRFVILGIEESIGPQANLGFGGSEHAFNSFLGRFLNMQSNEFCSGNSLFVLGSIKSNVKFENTESARSLVEELDRTVEKLIIPFIERGIIPIVIGGGHNNAFPLIKSVCLATQNMISVVNLDPHADCRLLEGRHSGNSFSYAFEEGYLNDYSVLGLHKAYNNQYILDYLREKHCFFTFFESYLGNEELFNKDIDFVVNKLESSAIGVELDLDSIAFMPTSAFTPSGFSLNQARYYVRRLASCSNVRYLHLPEAAPSNEYEAKITGKALAYLIWDFISERILQN